jgi:hypothetical protein
MFTYSEFLKLFESQKKANNEAAIVDDTFDMNCAADEEEIEENDEIEEIEDDSAENHIQKLCYVCSNPGTIDIFSPPCETFSTVPKSMFAKMKNVTIAQMITDISGETVSMISLYARHIALQAFLHLILSCPLSSFRSRKPTHTCRHIFASTAWGICRYLLHTFLLSKTLISTLLFSAWLQLAPQD